MHLGFKRRSHERIEVKQVKHIQVEAAQTIRAYQGAARVAMARGGAASSSDITETTSIKKIQWVCAVQLVFILRWKCHFPRGSSNQLWNLLQGILVSTPKSLLAIGLSQVDCNFLFSPFFWIDAALQWQHESTSILRDRGNLEGTQCTRLHCWILLINMGVGAGGFRTKPLLQDPWTTRICWLLCGVLIQT